jgi:hypothetical protein
MNNVALVIPAWTGTKLMHIHTFPAEAFFRS